VEAGPKDILKKRRNLQRTVLIILIFLFLIFSVEAFARIVILIVFIISNIMLALVKRTIPKIGIGKYLFGVEIIMFCTIITSVTFGSQLGMVMGGLLMAVNYIVERRVSRYFIITTILYSIIGYYAYFFRHYDIVLLGIATTLIYNAAVNIIVALLGANRTTMLIFSIMNILTNLMMFNGFARLVLMIILPS
jgi:hypothetical protein